MCTVSYLPKGEGNYILTSNRDESPLRETLPGEWHGDVWYPKDAVAGGTWIVAHRNGTLICLLNGAFVRHKRNLPYRRSRGTIPLELIEEEDIKHTFQQLDLHKIEPFTLVVYQNGDLHDLRWDEEQKHVKTLDASIPHIWSSAPLYDKHMQETREYWFAEWQKETEEYTAENILHFHRHAGDGDPFTDVCMNRMNMVRTVSITSLEKIGNQLTNRYFDVVNEEVA